MTEIKFALNRMVAPHMNLTEFLGLARSTGATGIEVRNDVDGQEFANGMGAKALAGQIADAGLEIASINALQRFNDWTPEREKEAVFLAKYARDLGAPGIALCPVHDGAGWQSSGDMEQQLRRALAAVKPILSDNGVIGYVEPLGMVGSTLTHQRTAIEAIAEIDGAEVFKTVHDTTQHYRARDTEFFPSRVGIVHISSFVKRDVSREKLSEPDRGFVNENDIAGNVETVARLIGGGYRGFVSHEPFDPVVHAMERPHELLKASTDYVRNAVAAMLEAALSGAPRQ